MNFFQILAHFETLKFEKKKILYKNKIFTLNAPSIRNISDAYKYMYKKINKNTTVHYFSFPKYVSRLKNFREFDFTKKIALMNPIKALL